MSHIHTRIEAYWAEFSICIMALYQAGALEDMYIPSSVNDIVSGLLN
jgi:hypothetical protein